MFAFPDLLPSNVHNTPLLQKVVNVDDADGIPILNDANNTYYQLVSVRKFWPGQHYHDTVSWGEAASLAFGMKHRGRSGRLAIVDSAQINEFLRVNFPIEREAWIGLRYWCHFKRLAWVNGASHKLTEFQNWGSRWNVGGQDPFESPPTQCNKQVQFWGVHYWPVKYGFNWNANGQKKRWYMFFVEYPPRSEAQPPADTEDVKPAS